MGERKRSWKVSLNKQNWLNCSVKMNSLYLFHLFLIRRISVFVCLFDSDADASLGLGCWVWEGRPRRFFLDHFDLVQSKMCHAEPPYKLEPAWSVWHLPPISDATHQPADQLTSLLLSFPESSAHMVEPCGPFPQALVQESFRGSLSAGCTIPWYSSL